jgi:hypothetical protein
MCSRVYSIHMHSQIIKPYCKAFRQRTPGDTHNSLRALCAVAYAHMRLSMRSLLQ